MVAKNIAPAKSPAWEVREGLKAGGNFRFSFSVRSATIASRRLPIPEPNVRSEPGELTLIDAADQTTNRTSVK